MELFILAPLISAFLKNLPALPAVVLRTWIY